MSLPRSCRVSFSKCISIFFFFKFIYSAHARTTMPYLEVTHKRIMRSLRNTFMKWITSYWNGFLKLLTHQIFNSDINRFSSAQNDKSSCCFSGFMLRQFDKIWQLAAF